MRLRILYLLFVLLALLPQQVQAKPLSIIRDEEIERSLKTLAEPVFKEAGLRKNDVQFVIIGDPAINAFVAGGMNIFFYTGLINKTETPEQLVGVIAHETSHITSGHLIRTSKAIENASVQTIVATVLGIAAAIGTGQGEAAAAISAGGQGLAQNQFLAHSRAQEASADQGAISFLEHAGISGKGMLEFFDTLQAQEIATTSSRAAYARTHPLTRDRIQFIENSVSKSRHLDTSLPEKFHEDHRRMKAKLLGFMHPERVDYTYEPRDTGIPAAYARAIAQYRLGHIDEAIKQTDALITREPDNPYFYELKGQMLMEFGRVDKAVPAYRKAVDLVPDSGLIRIAMAHALIENGREKPAQLKEAIDHLNQAKATEPRSARRHRLLATAYGRLGDEGLARLHLAEEALLLRDRPLAERQAKSAIAALEKGTPGWVRAQDVLRAAEEI